MGVVGCRWTETPDWYIVEMSGSGRFRANILAVTHDRMEEITDKADPNPHNIN